MRTLMAGLIFTTALISGAEASDWKAPPPIVPPASLKDRATPEYKAAASRAIINHWVEQEKLPYITVVGHDVKIAISAEVLAAFNVKSGASLPAEQVFKIIDADRNFERGLKELAPKAGVRVE